MIHSYVCRAGKERVLDLREHRRDIESHTFMSPKKASADADIDLLVARITQSKKYRKMDICEDTVRDLLVGELKHRKKQDAIHAAKEKLHHIVAPYLGEPDYAAAQNELKFVFQSNDQEKVKEACARIMTGHASTRERLAIVEEFYARIFAATCTPTALLDLACGLNPLSFPWTGLPTSTRYYAYDLNQRRVNFLNDYFSYQGLSGSVRAQDILLNSPEEEGDVAFILKEVHRFERRQRGCSLPLLDALRVRHLVISFPTRNLTGRRSLSGIYRQLFHNLVRQRPWRISEIEFKNELVFCVDKESIVSSPDSTSLL